MIWRVHLRIYESGSYVALWYPNRSPRIPFIKTFFFSGLLIGGLIFWRLTFGSSHCRSVRKFFRAPRGKGRDGKSGRERYGNGNGYDIFSPDRCFPTSPVTDFCSRVSCPTARWLFPSHFPSHYLPTRFPSRSRLWHSFSRPTSHCLSAHLPPHSRLLNLCFSHPIFHQIEHDLSQSPPISIRTNCCVDMQVHAGCKAVK